MKGSGTASVPRDIFPEFAGTMDCVSRHSWGPAVRGCWIIHYIHAGKGSYTTPRATYELYPGDIFIIRPGEVIYYEADSENPWVYTWFAFSAEVELPGAICSEDVLRAPYLEGIFSEIRLDPEAYLTAPGSRELLISAVWKCMGMLKRELASATVADGHIRNATAIMKAEYPKGITVEEVAARLHLNRSYFSKLFMQIVGVSPGDYLSELRMKRAAELLLGSSYSVAVVAASVGYSDQFIFSRAFKRRFGVSPRRYRPASEDKNER